MNTEDMTKEIMLKVFELINKGINVEFEEDWGKGTITIYCGNNHTHCGYPDATDEELIKSVYETLVLGKGLSFDIGLEEVRKDGSPFIASKNINDVEVEKNLKLQQISNRF